MNSTTSESVRETLLALTAPLREQLDLVDEVVSIRQAELNELRETQRTLRAALRHVDPSFAQEEDKEKAAKKSAKKNGSVVLHSVAPATLEDFRRFLLQHADELEDGFTGSRLGERSDSPYSKSHTQKMVTTLYEQGFLRLDRRGKGGGKIYKIVSR